MSLNLKRNMPIILLFVSLLLFLIIVLGSLPIISYIA